MADFIAAQYATVADTAAGCDVIVATAMSQFVGPSVAEKLGIPYRYVLFCPDVLDGLDGQDFDELFGKPINTHRATIGLPPVGDVGQFMFTARPLLAADPILGPWPGSEGFDVMQTGVFFCLASSIHALWCTRSRAAARSFAMSAIMNCTAWNSRIGFPNCWRVEA